MRIARIPSLSLSLSRSHPSFFARGLDRYKLASRDAAAAAKEEEEFVSFRKKRWRFTVAQSTCLTILY